jgi:hypothetical protein
VANTKVISSHSHTLRKKKLAKRFSQGSELAEIRKGTRKIETWCVTAIGETGFSRHTIHFLIFYNFRTNGTEKIMVLVASVILGLCKKIY